MCFVARHGTAADRAAADEPPCVPSAQATSATSSRGPANPETVPRQFPTDAVKRALGRILFVIHTPCFRPQFLPAQFIKTTDKVIPQLPRRDLVGVAQLF